jgi:platelet-activating factor acetylhydrolase IB subunit alpha
VNSVSYHPNGQVIATCSTDQTIKLWNYQTRQVFKTLQGHEHEVSSIEFLPPGGDVLISCSRDQTIKFWDTTSGYCLQTLREGHSDWIRKVSVNAKGSMLASSGKDE